MSRSGVNRTGRSTKGPRHVRLYHWFLETEAWKSLTGNQRAIYINIVARYRGPGSNNGRIPYSVREAAEDLHIGKSTAGRDLAVLQERGFLRVTTKGAFSWKHRHATEWQLTEFPSDVSDEISTKEFARWKPEIQNTVPSQHSTVPVAGPISTFSSTGLSKNAPDSSRSGTVSRPSTVQRCRDGYTSSLPGAKRGE